MAVEAGEAAAFEVIKAQAVFELAVVVLDAPADLRQVHQGGQVGVWGQIGELVVGGLLGVLVPLDQEWLGAQGCVGAAGFGPVWSEPLEPDAWRKRVVTEGRSRDGCAVSPLRGRAVRRS